MGKIDEWRYLDKKLICSCIAFLALLNLTAHANSSSNVNCSFKSRLSAAATRRLMDKYGINRTISSSKFGKLLQDIGLVNHHSSKYLDKDQIAEFKNNRADDNISNSTNSQFDEMCQNTKAVLRLWYNSNTSFTLKECHVEDLSPILIYLLANKSCLNYYEKDHRFSHKSKTQAMWRLWSGDPVVLKVWSASFLAVCITSFGGVATIFIIRPLIKSRFYILVVQFLIALAVGSLIGDALLHLLPHALLDASLKHEPHSDTEKSFVKDDRNLEVIYRCLTMLGGIYFFFIIERATTMYQSRRRKGKDGQRPSQVEKRKPGDRLCNPFHQSYGDPPMTRKGLDGNLIIELPPEQHQHCNAANCDGQDVSPTRVRGSDDPEHPRMQSSTQCSFLADNQLSEDKNLSKIDSPNEQATECRHNHSHSSQMKIRSIAWTVLIGDGLHNFCDGMAIGAAFAADFRSGISTAVAVFCHELPHELGDFAVLLQAGMSMKMALVANFISSLLCLIGMVTGIILVQNASQWVFMLTAGIFLYIALVDMMPELTTERNSREPGSGILFLAHNVGFALGAAAMLIISMLEH